MGLKEVEVGFRIPGHMNWRNQRGCHFRIWWESVRISCRGLKII